MYPSIRSAITAVIALTLLSPCARAQAPNPFVIRDLYVLPGGVPGNSLPSPVVELDGFAYFAATSSANGRELWRTDGTPEGAALVRDINPGIADSSPDSLTVWNGVLYFSADNGTNGRELWRTDGTAAGTRMVADLSTTSSNPVSLVPTPNALLFSATAPMGAASLCYAYDGNTVSNIRGIGACCPQSGGCVVTSWYECTSARGLWRGLSQVCDANPCYSPVPVSCCFPNKACTFVGASACEGAGGTPNAVGAACGPCPDPASAVCCTGSVCTLAAPASCSGSVYYLSGGCSPSPCAQVPRACCIPSGQCFMVLATLDCSSRSGTLLSTSVTCTSASYSSSCTSPAVICCRTNGVCNTATAASCTTTSGFIQAPGVTCSTVVCYAAATNANIADSGTPFPFNDRAIIFATNPDQVWVTDGTTQGTTLVASALVVIAPSERPPVAGNHLFFLANGKVWATDGTLAGTGLVRALNTLTVQPGWAGSGGLLYFLVTDANNAKQLWRSDTTPAGTFPLTTSTSGKIPADLTPFQDGLIFTFTDPNHQRAWWFTDGTVAGTRAVGPDAPYSLAGSEPSPVLAAGSTFFFSAGLSSSSPDLWASDGTPAGTRQVFPRPASDWAANPGSPLNWTGLKPIKFSLANGRVYFSGNDNHASPAENNVLWSTDGTLEGTRIAAHITAASDASLAELAPGAGNDLFFAARSATQGIELFKSGGTPGSTAMVKDIVPGAADSTPAKLTWNNGVLLFTARAGTPDSILHRSDGTAAGTYPFGSGSVNCCSGSVASNLAALNDRLVYFDISPGAGLELWQSDGTPAGTGMVVDAAPGSASGVLAGFTQPAVFNGAAYYCGNAGVYRSSGTAAGTELLLPAPNSDTRTPAFIASPGGVFFYPRWGGLWFTQGTPASTVQVSSLFAIDTSTFIIAGSRLFFAAYKPATGWEPWVSDGTPAGTHIITELNPGIPSGSDNVVPTAFRTIGSSVYFRLPAFSDTPARWYVTDGTPDGTRVVFPSDDFPHAVQAWHQAANGLLVETLDGASRALWWFTGSTTGMVNLTAGDLSVFPSYVIEHVTVDGSRTYFSRRVTTYKPHVYRTDGTPAGTTLIPSDAVSLNSLIAQAPIAFGDDVVIVTFSSDSAQPGHRIYRTHGPGSGFELLADLTPFTIQSQLVVVGSSIYFRAMSPIYGPQIFVSDGTTAGTRVVSPVNVDLPYLRPGSVRAAGSSFYFDHGLALYASDGTNQGTRRLRTFSAVPLTSAAALGNNLFFSGATTEAGAELWRTDGTVAGTSMVADLAPAATGCSPANCAAIGGRVFFSGANILEGGSSTGAEPCVSDGTAAGTRQIKRLAATTAGSSPSQFTDLNGISIFVAGNTTSGSEVYRSDGTAAGTYLLRNINPSTSTAAATQPQNLTRAGAFVFFTADDGVHGRELWRTDGTSAGTALVRDIWIGPGGSVPSNFVAAGNRLVFTAYTPETGVEFWTSDGTPQGTFMFLDVVPGPSGANLRSVTRAGNLIYFAATVPPSLSSLWCFDWVAGAPSLLCAANYDHSAALDLQDLFDFLNDWFAGASRADTNGSGLLEVRDVFEYLQLWFSGC